MSDPETLADRIDALEGRLTFQDDVIETLNKTVTEQWARIDALTRQLVKLTERLQEAESQMPSPTNEPPPHY
jgi:SlyX protein